MQYGKLQGNDGEYIYGNDGNPIFVQVDAAKKSLLPTWNKTVTLYHRTVDVENQRTVWTPHVIHNCFVGDTRSSNDSDTQVSSTSSYIVRMPSDIVATPCNEDLIFIGEVSFTIADSKGQRVSDRLHEYEGFTVKSVSDNRDKSEYLKHIRVEGI